MTWEIFANQLDSDSSYEDICLAYEKLGGDRLLYMLCAAIERDISLASGVPVENVSCHGPGEEYIHKDGRGGVYLCQDTASPHLEFFYIGKAKDFYKRVNDPGHPAAYDHDLVLIYVDKENEMLALEKKLIKMFHPKLNRQHNSRRRKR